MQDPVWYYAHLGHRRGPVSEDKMRQLIVDRQVHAEGTKVWRDGMAEWAALSDEPLFAESIQLVDRLEAEARNKPRAGNTMVLNKALQERRERNSPSLSDRVFRWMLLFVGWGMVVTLYGMLCFYPLPLDGLIWVYLVLLLFASGAVLKEPCLRKKAVGGAAGALGFLVLLIAQFFLIYNQSFGGYVSEMNLTHVGVYLMLSFIVPVVFAEYFYRFVFAAIKAMRPFGWGIDLIDE